MEQYIKTASLYKQTWHIGKIKARCLLEKRCTPVELKSLQRFNPTQENKREMLKKVPARFPANQDSIGIELVGKALPRGGYIPDEKNRRAHARNPNTLYTRIPTSALENK